MCYQKQMCVFLLGSGCHGTDEPDWCRFSAYFNQVVGVFPILIGKQCTTFFHSICTDDIVHMIGLLRECIINEL